MEKIHLEFRFHLTKNRLETFKDWPFSENCSCTPEKETLVTQKRKHSVPYQKYWRFVMMLAEAGFIYCGSAQEPDVARCYVCFKELDGWVPEDDPWQEHVNHSANCPFLKNNNPMGLRVKEFILLEKTRVLNIATRYIQESNSLWNKEVSAIEEMLGSRGKLKI